MLGAVAARPLFVVGMAAALIATKAEFDRLKEMVDRVAGLGVEGYVLALQWMSLRGHR